MFQHAYQSGSHLEIFDAKGLKQTEKINDKLFKISHPNMMTKTYDKYLKNYIYEVLPGTKASIQFPKDDRQELGLLQHYLVLQIFLGMDSTFSLELVISDTNTNKRRLIFTNSVKEIERNHFHIKIPLDNIKRGVWLNLSFDLLSYFELFPSSTFRALESFIVSGNFKLRKIFTMKDPIIESSASEESPALPYLSSNGSQLQKPQGILSKAVNYGLGIIYENQLILLKLLPPQQREYQTPVKPPRDSKQSTQNLSGSFNINTPTLLSFMGRAGKHRAEDSIDMSSKIKSNNTSRFLNASKSPRHRSKENSAIYLNDPAKNSLASTADSQKCMSLMKLTSPANNIKPRNFFSPRNEFQFPPATIKEDVSMRLSTEEPCVAPRSILLDQKQKSTIRIAPRSNDKTKQQTITPVETPKKSKSTVRINKLHEIIELNEKTSLYNRRMNQKKGVASYLLPNLSSPKLGMIAPELQTTTAAIRSPNMNNPWANNQGEFSFPFSRNSTSKFGNVSGFKTPRGTSEKPVPVKIELKPVRAKQSFHNKSSSKGSIGGSSRKDTITTAATTPKDMMMSDTDRFSILSRSGDEYGIRHRNRELLMSREDANYKDEIESIEENLEYENHSNTSGICASHILNNEEEEGLDFIRGDKSTSPDLYKPFLKKENEEESSTGSVIYHGGRKGRQLSKLDTGKTKRIAKQFEDKVMDIVSNNRPYSPPFQRKIEVQKPSWIVKRDSLSSLQRAAMVLKTEEAVPIEKEEVFERALQTDRYCVN